MKFTKPLILTLAFLVCMLIFGFFVRLPKKQTDTNATVYKSTVQLIHKYLTCGHIENVETFENVSYTSEDELKRRFEGYEITSSDSEKIILTQNIKSYCPMHFIAVLKGGKITVSNLFDGQKAAVIDIKSLSLSDNEKKLLTEGHILHSKEALTSFIEDFTS